MHPCVAVIRNDIENLTMNRIAFRFEEINRDIRYATWHGFINENLYIKLCNELEEKRSQLYEEFFV